MPVFLVGFMGSGKTHWGKIWAEEQQLDFYDLDEIIQADQGRSINTIFDADGEEFFRKLETVTLMRFTGKENCLLACGGGTPCYNNNMDWMNNNGTTVYLDARPGFILDRVKEEIDKRPLINKLNESELLFFIEQKLKERVPIYRQAKIVLDAESLDKNSLMNINKYA